jgi:maltooligosyltrehalose trehalohydrolase
MGEEYGERHPFPYFVSFDDPALVKAVREGRAAEFKGFAGEGLTIPDPESEDSFLQAVLSWTYDDQPGATLLSFYRSLISMRKTRPALQGRTRDSMIVYPATDDTLLLERKILNDHVFIWLHFGAGPVRLENPTGHVLGKIFDSACRQWLGPGHRGDAAAAGEGGAADILPGQPVDLAPWSALVFEKKQ